MITRPDVLVLGGGGLLGVEWMMGVLGGIEDATGFDLRGCEYFVGTSAGSIVAARLVGGRSPRRPDDVGRELVPASADQPGGLAATALATARRAGSWTLAAWTPLAPAALAAGGGRAGALLRAAMLSSIPRPYRTLDDLRTYIEHHPVRFDGRLRIAAVERRTGRRVVFGSPGSPYATVAQAVQASCSVPWLFAPVVIGGNEYVDGGVWSATNLDAAPAGRDTHVLCLNPTAGISGSHRLLAAARRVARTAAALEALSLKRKGAIVQTIVPSLESAATMGGDFMDPKPRAHVLAAGYHQGLSVARARAAD
jgi:NTE family protein